jgi:hypothetical protein
MVSGSTLQFENYNDAYSGPGNIRIYTRRAMPFETVTFTLSFTEDSGTQEFLFAVVKIAGVNSSGLKGSGAFNNIDTSSASSGTTLTNDLSMYSSDLVHYTVFAHLKNEDISIGGSFTQLSSIKRATPNVSMRIGYKVNTASSTATWTTSSEAVGAAFALNPAAASTFIPKILMIEGA